MARFSTKSRFFLRPFAQEAIHGPKPTPRVKPTRTFPLALLICLFFLSQGLAAECLKSALRVLKVGEQYRGEEKGESDFFGKNDGKVIYLKQNRARYAVSIVDGVILDARGKPFQTTDKEMGSIFVLGQDNKLYISNTQEVGRFHHSSLVAGEGANMAGQIWIEKGRLIPRPGGRVRPKISDRSGHYRPDPNDMVYFLLAMKRAGLDLSKTEIYSEAPEYRATGPNRKQMLEAVEFLNKLQDLKDPEKIKTFAFEQVAITNTTGFDKDFLRVVLCNEIVYRLHSPVASEQAVYLDVLKGLLNAQKTPWLHRAIYKSVFEETLLIDQNHLDGSIELLGKLGWNKASVDEWLSAVDQAAYEQRPETTLTELRSKRLAPLRAKLRPYLKLSKVPFISGVDLVIGN